MGVLPFLASLAGWRAAAVDEHEVRIPTGEETMPGTLYLPAMRRPLPGWVVLHGITVAGRRHSALTRFARAFAASGAAVLIPEIRAWTELTVDSGAAERAIGDAARYLGEHDAVSEGGVGVVGFSFGATQAIMTSTRPDMHSKIRAVAGFGAYADLARTIHFMFTGEHEWRGKHYHLEPDPYGRWIATATYLTRTPGYEAAQAVALGCRTLATEAGRTGYYAGDAALDPLKTRIEDGLSPDERELWRVLAPPAAVPPPRDAARTLAGQITATALRVDDRLDPPTALPNVSVPVALSHGLADHLIPFTESLRLRSKLPPEVVVSATVTRLFSHSGGAAPLHAWEYPIEVWRYLRLLQRVLRM